MSKIATLQEKLEKIETIVYGLVLFFFAMLAVFTVFRYGFIKYCRREGISRWAFRKLEERYLMEYIQKKSLDSSAISKVSYQAIVSLCFLLEGKSRVHVQLHHIYIPVMLNTYVHLCLEVRKQVSATESKHFYETLWELYQSLEKLERKEYTDEIQYEIGIRDKKDLSRRLHKLMKQKIAQLAIDDDSDDGKDQKDTRGAISADGEWDAEFKDVPRDFLNGRKGH